MILREWFRPPRHLLALFVAVIALPAIVLAWLGWRTFEQDKALERERLRERLEAAADRSVAELNRRLDELSRQLPVLAAPPGVSLPEDFLLVTIRAGTIHVAPAGRVLYYPRVPETARVRDDRLAAAEALEFRRREPASAARAFRQIARSPASEVRAAALVGLARCLRKSGRRQDALAAYTDLARLGIELRVEGTPVDLLARHAQGTLLSEMNAPGLTDHAAALHGDLQRGRWVLDRASYEFYSGEARAWFSPSTAPPPGPIVLALSDAVTEIDRLRREHGSGAQQGRETLWLHERPLLIVWSDAPDQLTSLVTGPSWFSQLAPVSKATNIALVLTDGGSHVVAGPTSRLPGPVVVRQSADTGLPWTMSVASADPAKDLAMAGGYRRMALTGLIVIGVLVLTGGFLVERALARELAAARLQADFVATVSHEFRSPLTSMKHLLEMLEQGAVPSDERRQRYYRVLSGETERLRQLVEHLLNFRRMEAGRAEYRFESVDAGALVEQVAADFRTQLASGDRLAVGVSGHDVRVRADREALARVIRNLLDNAAKYSPESAPVHLDLDADDSRVRIAVRDQCGGIPPDEQKAIFKKFYRGAAARTSGIKGTGIGLATVDYIVRAHHGEIRLTSTPGEGCVFTVEFRKDQGSGIGDQGSANRRHDLSPQRQESRGASDP